MSLIGLAFTIGVADSSEKTIHNHHLILDVEMGSTGPGTYDLLHEKMTREPLGHVASGVHCSNKKAL